MRKTIVMMAVILCATVALTGVAMAQGSADEVEATKVNPTDLTTAVHKSGFKWTTENKKFSLRLFTAAQFRYTYMGFDDEIKGNTEDYSNFYMRRARLWWDGNAYDERIKYYFHLQLEPQGSVNLHDAWVQYNFSDMLQLGIGRNKIPYGLEFLHSGFGLNFIERSVMYGETDINSGGGYSKWPGGGTGGFGLVSFNSNTGFPTGGVHIYRSQGISLSGLREVEGGSAFEYQIGVWNGRDSRARSNDDSSMLWSARIGWHPFGRINWLFQGDTKDTDGFKIAFWAAAYTDGDTKNKDASGASVTPYDTTDTGYNLSTMMVFKGFSAEIEYGVDSYEMDRPGLSRGEYDRNGWRVQAGYFVVPKKVEVVARYAQIERLEDPTPEALVETGLGFAQVWNPATGAYESAMEDTISEITAGLNFYLDQGHQHKLFFDVSQLTRSFLEYNGFEPDDQEEIRFRSMLQLKF